MRWEDLLPKAGGGGTSGGWGLNSGGSLEFELGFGMSGRTSGGSSFVGGGGVGSVRVVFEDEATHLPDGSSTSRVPLNARGAAAVEWQRNDNPSTARGGEIFITLITFLRRKVKIEIVYHLV